MRNYARPVVVRLFMVTYSLDRLLTLFDVEVTDFSVLETYILLNVGVKFSVCSKHNWRKYATLNDSISYKY